MIPRFIFLLSLIAVVVAHGLQKNELDNPIENDLNFNWTNIPADNEKAVTLYRQKRGWGSVVFTGVSLLTRFTSLGLTLANALSAGCASYPSICTNKKEIERLDIVIKGKTQLYETEFNHAKKSYWDLRTATTNNGYISYYMNKTIQLFDTIKDINDKVARDLENNLPKIFNGENKTFEMYFDEVVGKLEYRLSDLNDMLLKHKQIALIGIVVGYVVEATINRFVNVITNAYRQVSNGGEYLQSTHMELWERTEVNDPTKPKTIKTVRKQLKLVPKVFKTIGKNFVKTKNDLLKWKRIHNLKGFKGKLAHTLKPVFKKLDNIKQFLSPKTNAKFVKNYKLGATQITMSTLGIIADAISQGISIGHQWKEVASEMTKARSTYEIYYKNLTKELEIIQNETKKLDELWENEAEIFKNLSLSYETLVIYASKYSNFSNVIGLSKLPVNINMTLFSVDFDNLNNQSLLSNQQKVIDFLKEVDNNFTEIEDEFRAREVLYNNTMLKSEQDEPVHDILSDITNILKFSTSKTMKRFGSQVTERDLVCAVSVLRYNNTEYDFFPLAPFRPRCEVNSSTFDIMALQASSKRKNKLMLKVVTNSVKTDTVDSLSKLVDSIHIAYLGVTDKTIAAFGSLITEQDIICMISEKFPSLDTYDFINLAPFRPNCSSINPDHFKALLQDSSKQRQLANGIKSDLQACHEYKFCRCLKSLALQYQLTEADVTRAIKQLSPSWEENHEAILCGPPCNSCVHL